MVGAEGTPLDKLAVRRPFSQAELQPGRLDARRNWGSMFSSLDVVDYRFFYFRSE